MNHQLSIESDFSDLYIDFPEILISSDTKISDIKKILNGIKKEFDCNGYNKNSYNIRLEFGDGSILSPDVFNSSEWDNSDFKDKKLQDSVLYINEIKYVPSNTDDNSFTTGINKYKFVITSMYYKHSEFQIKIVNTPYELRDMLVKEAHDYYGYDRKFDHAPLKDLIKVVLDLGSKQVKKDWGWGIISIVYGDILGTDSL